MLFGVSWVTLFNFFYLEDNILRLGRIRFLERNKWKSGFDIHRIKDDKILKNDWMQNDSETQLFPHKAFNVFNKRCDEIVAQLKESSRETDAVPPDNSDIWQP